MQSGPGILAYPVYVSPLMPHVHNFTEAYMLDT